MKRTGLPPTSRVSLKSRDSDLGLLRTFCISHVKDVDGVGAAAIVMAATGAELKLSEYAVLMEDLGSVPQGIDRFVLCDLGSDNSNATEFIGKMTKLAARAEVVYIDHHFMSDANVKRLRAAGVKVVHDELECSSMLAYKTFAGQVPEGAKTIALMGAVTDYMDDSPMAKRMMEQSDRQFVLLESTLLAYAMANRGKEAGFAERMAGKLAAMKLPHEIEGVPGSAVKQLEAVVKLGKEVKKSGVRLGNLAYMVTAQHSTGNVAKLLIGAFGVPVGVALKEQEEGWYEVSLRGTSECKVHLGKTISGVASKLGGNGGGHRKAAGCRIPRREMKALLAQLSRRV